MPVRLVTYLRYRGDPFFLHQQGYFFHQSGLVLLVGDLGDNNRLAAIFALLHMGTGSHNHYAAPGFVGLTYSRPAQDKTTGGEIRAGDDFHQLMHRDIGIFNQSNQAVNNLDYIMGWDLGGHTNGNTLRSVDQDIGNPGGHNRGLQHGVIVGGNKINGFLVQIGNQFLVKPGHPCLGIPHCGRGITVHGAEVTLAIHQGIAQGKMLSHPDQGVINSGITMWMILTNDITDNTSRFDVGTIVTVAQLAHGKQGTPVHGFQTITHIGQCPAHNNGHGIVQVGLAQFLFNRNGRLFRLVVFCFCCHA